MNPYNFVRLGKAAPRQPVVQHEKFVENCGIITCRLRTLTPIFISGPQERAISRDQHQELFFLRNSARPIIPGSSLKGVIRSVAEALSGSCLILPNDPRSRSADWDKLSYWDKGSAHEYPLPDGFSPCGMAGSHKNYRTSEACPACRIFGYLHKSEVHLGHVGFSTAYPSTNCELQKLTLEPFGAPAPRHGPFYGTIDSKFREPRGRKFYYHRMEGARTSSHKTGQNKTVEAIMPDVEFEFTVDYRNLHDDELALLIFSLTLEKEMRHKIGMGKGVGLGSVSITVTEWQQIDTKQRYNKLNAKNNVLAGSDLEKALAQQRQIYLSSFAEWEEPLKDLQEIWKWEKNARDRQYPSYFWFKDFSDVPLENVPDDAGQYRVSSRGASRPPADQRPAAPILDAAESTNLKQLAKQAQKELSRQEEQSKVPYQHRDIERAKVVKVEPTSFEVSLSKLPQEHFSVKKNNLYRPYSVGMNVRVRILLNAQGVITRIEEI